MTGPEHYKRAESLLDQLRRAHASMTERVNPERAAAVLAEAQVHATLALAAATALIEEKPRGGSFDAYRAWESVAGDAKPETDPVNNIW